MPAYSVLAGVKSDTGEYLLDVVYEVLGVFVVLFDFREFRAVSVADDEVSGVECELL